MTEDKEQKMMIAMQEAENPPQEEVEGKQHFITLLYKKTGQAQAFNLMQLMSRLAVTKIVKEIHDAKLYKMETSEFEKFCQNHFGVGRQFFYDGFKILKSLAMDFCRYGDTIGLTFGDIRRIARLEHKNFVATADNIIIIEGIPYELIPQNKTEIQEAIAELTTRVQAEKRRGDGYQKMAKNRQVTVEKLEQELEYISNSHPHQTRIDQVIEQADDNISTGLAQLVSAAQMISESEQKTGERAPEREKFMGLLGKTKFALMEAIDNAEYDLGELSELEIRKGFEQMGMSLPEKSVE